jgi:hypothetical protein
MKTTYCILLVVAPPRSVERPRAACEAKLRGRATREELMSAELIKEGRPVHLGGGVQKFMIHSKASPNGPLICFIACFERSFLSYFHKIQSIQWYRDFQFPASWITVLRSNLGDCPCVVLFARKTMSTLIFLNVLVLTPSAHTCMHTNSKHRHNKSRHMK